MFFFLCLFFSWAPFSSVLPSVLECTPRVFLTMCSSPPPTPRPNTYWYCGLLCNSVESSQNKEERKTNFATAENTSLVSVCWQSSYWRDLCFICMQQQISGLCFQFAEGITHFYLDRKFPLPTQTCVSFCHSVCLGGYKWWVELSWSDENVVINAGKTEM